MTKEVEIMPASIQGLNLPCLPRVRSMMLPMMGSFKASKIRAPNMMAVMVANWPVVSCRVKSTKVSKKLVTRV